MSKGRSGKEQRGHTRTCVVGNLVVGVLVVGNLVVGVLVVGNLVGALVAGAQPVAYTPVLSKKPAVASL